jgi:hypothetical protein
MDRPRIQPMGRPRFRTLRIQGIQPANA